MRVFVGIPIPEGVSARVATFVDALRPLAALRWSQVADLHVTMKFIGERSSADVAKVESVLRALAPRAAFSIAVRGVGWFPDALAPRVFWAGIDAPPALIELAGDTDRALASLGVPVERRAYAPHLTLARVPPGARLDALRQAPAFQPSTDFGAFTAEHFALYESGGRADGVGRYRALATFPLGVTPSV